MAELIVITGPPGAGKSTVAARLVELFDPSALVAGDEFFRFLRRGAIAPWVPGSDRHNTAVIQAAAAAAGRLSEHCHVVYEGVVGPWFLPTFARWSGQARLHYIVILPELTVCLERVSSRTGHGFTDLDVTRDMHRQFATAELTAGHLLIIPGDNDVATMATDIAQCVVNGSHIYVTGQ